MKLAGKPTKNPLRSSDTQNGSAKDTFHDIDHATINADEDEGWEGFGDGSDSQTPGKKIREPEGDDIEISSVRKTKKEKKDKTRKQKQSTRNTSTSVPENIFSKLEDAAVDEVDGKN